MKAVMIVVLLILGLGLPCVAQSSAPAAVPEGSEPLWPEQFKAEAQEAKKLLTGDVSDFTSENNLVRQLAYGEFARQQHELVEKLVRIAEDEHVDRSFEGTFHLAVKALGMLRAVDAVPLLSENLSYLPEELVIDGSPTAIRIGGTGVYESYYPCALSLSRIGQPSVGVMMEILQHSDDLLKRRLASWVILTVEGEDEALHRIDGAADKTADKAVRRRLADAVAHFKSYKPDFTNPYMNRALQRSEGGKTSGENG